MTEELNRRLERLRADRTSGASELVEPAIELLRLARARGPEVLARTAEGLREAQPSMAPLLNLASAALRESGDPGAMDEFERRWRRGEEALVRAASAVLAVPTGASRHFVTCSYSRSVLACLRFVAARGPVRVSCGEGRPALEGRRLAAALAAGGAAVALLTDAALATALAGADALVLGADAVASRWFVNKVGSAALAAAAAQAGTPVYVLASREKFLDADTAAWFRIEDHDPREVWDSAPPNIIVRNPYFERVPRELATAIITG
jgi:translation initiation factor 2B subunit (eIF-2B alpha/beta/delta family)